MEEAPPQQPASALASVHLSDNERPVNAKEQSFSNRSRSDRFPLRPAAISSNVRLKETSLRLKPGEDGSPENSFKVSNDKKSWKNLMALGTFGLSKQRLDKISVDVEKVELKRKIGEGSIGDVYEGTLAGQKVAVKTLRAACDPNSVEMRDLVTELKMLSKDLNHPKLVVFKGACLAEGSLLLVMELMEGGNVEQFFDARKGPNKHFRLTFPRALSWSIDLLEGLAYLHGWRRPILHRDLKPANLMLTAKWETVKIGDFGLCKINKTDDGLDDTTHSVGLSDYFQGAQYGGPGRRMSMTTNTGTPRYMAPEIAMGSTDYNEKVDIYSAALLVWQIVEGVRPWEAYTGQIASQMAVTGDRPLMRPAVFPTELRELVAQGWHQNPMMRPQAAEFLQRLKAVKQQETGKGGGGCFAACFPSSKSKEGRASESD